jgi:hypothetical protein
MCRTATVQVARARCAVVLVLLNCPAVATSIVALLDSGRILFAADTHGDKLDPASKRSDETECKIVPLGNAAFALTGNMDYVRNQPDDPIASWDSRSDAREAYALQSGDLIATAADWASRAKRHYLSFYFANRVRVAQLAKANDQNILLVGMFVGFRGGEATLIMEIVYLDEHQSAQILDKHVVLPARTLPYTSNAITQDLIEGHSARTKTSAAAWLTKVRSIPPANRAFRRIEFLIQETAKYDKAVGARVNVVEIFPDKNPRWIQNFTCRAN